MTDAKNNIHGSLLFSHPTFSPHANFRENPASFSPHSSHAAISSLFTASPDGLFNSRAASLPASYTLQTRQCEGMGGGGWESGRCEGWQRRGKRSEGGRWWERDEGWGLRKMLSSLFLPQSPPTGVESNINMVIFPQARSKCWRVEVIYMLPWARKSRMEIPCRIARRLAKRRRW